MDISKRFGSLALTALLLAFSGCKSASESLPSSLEDVPPPPPEQNEEENDDDDEDYDADDVKQTAEEKKVEAKNVIVEDHDGDDDDQENVEEDDQCTACSVTCPMPAIKEQIKESSLSTSDKRHLLARRVKDISMVDAHGTLGGKVASYRNQGAFFISGDFLYWKAEEDGLAFAAKATPLEPLQTSSLGFPYLSGFSYKEKLLEPKFTWMKGYRADLGYRFGGNDNWEIDFVGTWFYNRAKKSADSSTPGLMYPTWGGFPFASGEIFTTGQQNANLISPITNAWTEWGLHYTVVDFELGRHYFVSKAFSLRPCVGARGAWIRQDYSVHYVQSISYFLNHHADNFSELIAPASMFAKNNFQGVGPRLGLDLQWHLNCHFSILGKLSGSLLYGPLKTSQKYSSTLSTFFLNVDLDSFTTFPNILFNNRHNEHRFEPNLEAALGLQFDSKHFTLGVFYELSEWFDQNQLVRSMPLIEAENATLAPSAGIIFDPYVKEHGNLGLGGLTVKARVDF